MFLEPRTFPRRFGFLLVLSAIAIAMIETEKSFLKCKIRRRNDKLNNQECFKTIYHPLGVQTLS